MPSMPQRVLTIPTKTGGRRANLALVSLSHGKVLKFATPVTVPSFLPFPQSDPNLKRALFSNHSTTPSISFSENHQNPKAVIKVKRDIFPFLMPINTATSQSYSPAFCFGMLLLPHISCHTRTTAACSHRATRTLPVHPPHLTPQRPISHHPNAL